MGGNRQKSHLPQSLYLTQEDIENHMPTFKQETVCVFTGSVNPDTPTLLPNYLSNSTVTSGRNMDKKHISNGSVISKQVYSLYIFIIS